MIDLHTHLLPGMDDGSDSVETSLAMLRQCAGVEGICATPHFYADRDAPDRFLRRRAEAWERLRAALPEDCPRIRLGAEVRYFDGLSRAEALPELCIDGTKLLLLEMPFGRWTERMLTEVEGICRRGLQPVAAHIERYMGLVPKGLLRAFTELDILLQCNAEFFLERRTARKALRFMAEGRVAFLGSDAHNVDKRPPNLAEAAALIERKLGPEPLAALREREAFFGLHAEVTG